MKAFRQRDPITLHLFPNAIFDYLLAFVGFRRSGLWFLDKV